MDNNSEKLNSALEKLKQNPNFDLETEKDEISPLLKIAASLFALPKNPIPTPLMNHRYASVKAKNFWFAWTHISRFATASTAVMLLVSAFTVTAYASYKSAPGQTLFVVKKSAEKLQLVLASNQDQKANLQVEITKKRLSEARMIFQNPTSNIKQEKAALTELTDQTRNAIEVINTITANNPTANNNHPLLSSLENITKEQQALLEDIKPGREINEAAGTALVALNENSAKISEIKQFIAIASNDPTLTKLSGDPNSVAVLGEISEITKDKITVENTTFTLNSQTVIKNAEGIILSPEVLKLKVKINISGNKDKDSLVAKHILITNQTANAPEVKSASTENASIEAAKPQTSTTSSSAIKQPEQIHNPNQVRANYLFEDPSPQYVK